MAYRLRNQSDQTKALGVSAWAWHSLLDLAERFGWNARGTLLPEWEYATEPPTLASFGEYEYELDLQPGSYTIQAPDDDGRLVTLEDALNMADALERAFLQHEPQRMGDYNEIYLGGLAQPKAHHLRPGIGALTELIEFCRLGAFSIERF